VAIPIGLCDFANCVGNGNVLDVDGCISQLACEGLQFFRSVDVVVSAHATAHGYASNIQGFTRQSFKNSKRQERSDMLPKTLTILTARAILRHS
jgi:hypothetical protein